jgi:pteridine reductase
MPTPFVALVTGSGKRRVGRAVADLFADRGYRLVLHYHTSAVDAEEAIASYTSAGVQAVAVRADLSDEAAVETLVRTAMERFGGLDVLVNCAAIWRRKSLEETRADDVRAHFEANVLGTFLCARAAGLAMAKQPDGGCIVNIGDWAEARPYPEYSAYFATKGAVPTLTRCLAVELGTRNPRVRVNCVLPGPVMLPPDLSEAERKEAIAATLTQREGTPQHVARAVLSLVENDYITGACLNVDGGRSVYAGGR